MALAQQTFREAGTNCHNSDISDSRAQPTN